MSFDEYSELTDEQVKNLQDYQDAGEFHPYTCCDHQVMNATKQGLVCPKCGRVQRLLHDFTLLPIRQA